MKNNLKWFQYRQDNSGGYLFVDNRVDVNVHIQANSPAEADSIAEGVGIYFDGVQNGCDCECCGDRWSRQWGDDAGTDVPCEYGRPVTHGLYAKFYPYGSNLYPVPFDKLNALVDSSVEQREDPLELL